METNVLLHANSFSAHDAVPTWRHMEADCGSEYTIAERDKPSCS